MNDERLDTPLDGASESPPESETSAVQDLLKAIGFGSARPKKRALTPPPQADKDDTGDVAEIPVQGKPAESAPDYTADQVAADEPAEFIESIPIISGPSLDDQDTDAIPNPDGELSDELVPWKDADEHNPKRLPIKNLLLRMGVLVLIVVVVFAGFRFVPLWMEPRPPSPDIVATYNDKVITADELMSFVQLENIREGEHSICEKHGLDHSKCDAFEECETHPIHSMEAYQQIVRIIAVQNMILDWADSNGITQREDVNHGLKDLLESANLDSLINQIHEDQITPESIPKWEVQQYYDENRDTYEGRAFVDVEAEIRTLLVEQKDAEFFPAYIEELKKTAGLEVNFDILRVANPTDSEMRLYYDNNLEQYAQSASVKGLEMSVGLTNNSDPSVTAREAYEKLQQGESLTSIAAEYSRGGVYDEVEIAKGTRSAVFDEQVWRLEPGESAVFEDDNGWIIFQLSSKTSDGAKPFDSVRTEIQQTLLKQNMDTEYELRKDEALFSVHGRRYTLGEFYVEYNELPVQYQQAFASFNDKKALVEQMIAKELLLEEYGDDTQSAEDQHRLDDLKQQYLSQVYHQENIDAQIGEITDEEAMAFYEENKGRLMEPPSVKISMIWLSKGKSDDEEQTNRSLANEALASIRGGASFADVAKQYSQDGGGEQGGAIEEWLYGEYLPQELSYPIFAAQVGDVTDVLEISDGFYIFKVDDRKEQRQQEYEELADAIKNHLKDEKHMEMEANLETQMITDSGLVVYDRTLRTLLKDSMDDAGTEEESR